MSGKAQVNAQAETAATPTAARIPQRPVAIPEREADRPDIATQLEGASRLGHSLAAVRVDSSAPLMIQRQEIPEEEEEELQTKPADGVRRRGRGEGLRLDDETAGRINRARGGGQPLDGTIQAQMREAMGHDFSGVRVHTDAEADALNQQLSARAFTTGRDIFFRRGKYNPGSGPGRELIAHELSHVVQQRTGQVSAGGSGATLRPAGEAFEQEADKAAEVATRSTDPSVRRQTLEDTELQMQEGAEVIQANNGDNPEFEIRVAQGYLRIAGEGTRIMTQGADGSCVAIAGNLTDRRVFCAHIDIAMQTNKSEEVKSRASELLPLVLTPESVARCSFVAASRTRPTPGLIDAIRDLYRATDGGEVGGIGLDSEGNPKAFGTGGSPWAVPEAKDATGAKCTIGNE